MNKHILLFLFISILFSYTGCKTVTDPVKFDTTREDINKKIQIIHLLLNSNNLTEAGEKIKELQQMYPQNEETDYLNGWLFLKKKDLEQSETIFKNILDKNEKNPLVYAGLARIYRIKGDNNKASEYIEKGLLLLPTLSILWLEKGILEYENKEYKKAIVNFNKAYNYNNSNTDAYFFKYLSYLQSGREIDEVKLYWENIINKKPLKSWYFLYHSHILYQLDQIVIAKAIAESGLNYFPNDSYLLNLSANYLIMEYDEKKDQTILDKSRDLISKCINNNDLQPEFIDTYLTVLMLLDETSKIQSEINKYLLIFPDNELIIKWSKTINEN